MEFEFTPMLATTYDPIKHTNINNWIITEKLDGVRGIYKDGHFYSRNDNEFYVPKEFYSELLLIPELNGNILDGELWINRKKFDKLVGLVKKDFKTIDEFMEVKFMVFDIPTLNMKYIDRIKYLENILVNLKYTKFVPYTILKNKNDIPNILNDIENIKGEGLILRDPNSFYENKRSKYMLKIKSSYTDEAIFIGYEISKKGKYKDLISSYKLEWINPNNDKINFNVGSGFNEIQRQLNNIPKIGSLITFKYSELTKSGVPRHPIFLSIRDYE